MITFPVTRLSAIGFLCLWYSEAGMGPTVADLVAGIFDRIEDRPLGPGRPPMPTAEVVATLRFFLREGVQWRELQAADGRASGSTLRRRLDESHTTALLRRVHAVLVRMAGSGPAAAASSAGPSCAAPSPRAERRVPSLRTIFAIMLPVRWQARGPVAGESSSRLYPKR